MANLGIVAADPLLVECVKLSAQFIQRFALLALEPFLHDCHFLEGNVVVIDVANLDDFKVLFGEPLYRGIHARLADASDRRDSGLTAIL